MKASNIAAFIADLFFPNRCPICREFIAWDDFICDKCSSCLTPFPDGVCQKCGKVKCICNSEKVYCDRSFVCFYYEGLAREGILSLKDGHKEFGYYLGKLLGERISVSGLDADCVIPVPMSDKKRRTRGYNQAEVIARQIADINRIPLFNNIIFKKDSAEQHTLSRTERMKNVSGFYGGSALLYNKKLILCDDVITTGATVNRCAGILKEMGAAEVYAAAGTTTKLKKDE